VEEAFVEAGGLIGTGHRHNSIWRRVVKLREWSVRGVGLLGRADGQIFMKGACSTCDWGTLRCKSRSAQNSSINTMSGTMMVMMLWWVGLWG
jgi:hypothetical protein